MPFISPQNDEIKEALEKENRKLLHCLNCGGQVVDTDHGDSCLICGSGAFVVEQYDEQ